MARKKLSSGRRPRVVEIEQNGEYLTVQLEIDGRVRTGKYMRYGWEHAPWSAEQEVERLLKDQDL